ncbi:SRPBCC domain-containing protein [Nocardiopsis sp. NPDC050513]|uniref:SRPBCC domain-containing protein n=1 Tax=Nocardiopsis sp. NPDC050513 TaxID=3364338 RepID=UPI0037A73C17
MDTPGAELRTVAGESELRFERRLAHPVPEVWRALTDPIELEHWFPAIVEADLRVGGYVRFTFADAPEAAGEGGEGEVTEYEPPRVFGFRWGKDALRFELGPDGPGSRLVFTQGMGGGVLGRLAAARDAYGWDVCLAALEARLARRDFEEPQDFLGPVERYTDAFGLGEGEVESADEGLVVRFARDLMWRSLDSVWEVATEGVEPRVGAAPPPRLANGYVTTGLVTGCEPPRALEYAWLYEGELAGTVLWEFAHEPELGTRVELTQTVPDGLSGLLPVTLAAWQTHLELFFAAVNGDVRCPWPEDRTEELRRRYDERLA